MIAEGYVGDVVRVAMKNEHFVLAALAFVRPAKIGEIFLSKDLRLHQNGIPGPDGHRGPMGLRAPLSPTLYNEVYKLGLFKIVKGSEFDVSSSWLAFERE